MGKIIEEYLRAITYEEFPRSDATIPRIKFALSRIKIILKFPFFQRRDEILACIVSHPGRGTIKPVRVLHPLARPN